MVCSIARPYTQISEYAESNYRGQNQSISNSYWYGLGASRLGLTGEIVPNDYHNLYQGKDRVGEFLRRQLSNKNSRPGRDLTFSAPKSVSLLALILQDPEVMKAHAQAVGAALDYAQQNCIFTRTGKAGKFHQQTDNLVAAVFPHDLNRNHDPQLHTHCVIFNLTQAGDGKWRAMDNRQLYQQKMTLGAIYHHSLGQQLQQLGYSIDWNRNGTIEVQGYSARQLEIFSSRKQEIVNAVGIDANPQVKAQACLSTRRDKVYLNRDAQNQNWQQKIAQTAISHPQPNAHSISPTRQFFSRLTDNFSTRQQPTSVAKAISILSNNDTQFSFSPHQLLRQTIIQNQGKDSLIELQNQIKIHPDLIPIGDGRFTTVELFDRHKQQNQNKLLEQKSVNSNRILVQKIPDRDSKIDTIAHDFARLDAKKRSQTLVLTDTVEAKHQITNQIRQQLLTRNKLGRTQYTINILQDKNLDKSQQAESHNYSVGEIIKFNKNSAKFDKDLYYRVERIDSQNNTLQLRDQHNHVQDLSCDRHSERICFTAQPLELRQGEMMQFTKSHYQNQTLRNARQRFTVLDFEDNGNIKIQTRGKTFSLDPEQLFHSNYGYADTVDNYQGRSINNCLYACDNYTLIPQQLEDLTQKKTNTRLTVYTNNAQSFGLSIDSAEEKKPSNSISTLYHKGITSSNGDSPQGNNVGLPITQSEPPTRKQEWQLLLAATYLVEQHGHGQTDKLFQIGNGTTISRNSSGLSVTRNSHELLFDSHNATVKNTFDSTQMNQLIQSTTNVKQKLLQSQSHSQSRNHGYSIDL